MKPRASEDERERDLAPCLQHTEARRSRGGKGGPGCGLTADLSSSPHMHQTDRLQLNKNIKTHNTRKSTWGCMHYRAVISAHSPRSQRLCAVLTDSLALGWLLPSDPDDPAPQAKPPGLPRPSHVSHVLIPLCFLGFCTDGINRLFATSPCEEQSFCSSRPCVTGEDWKETGMFQTGFLGRAPGSSTASLEAEPRGRVQGGDRRRDFGSLTHLDLCYILERCVKLCFDKGFGGQKPRK